MKDTIYKQVAIDMLKMDTTIIPYKKARQYVDLTIEEISERLKKLPSAQPEQRWIPVTERLPEYGKSVLCYFKEDEDFGVNHVIDEEDGEWFIDGVTAWMPLPEPYSGGENGE